MIFFSAILVVLYKHLCHYLINFKSLILFLTIWKYL